MAIREEQPMLNGGEVLGRNTMDMGRQCWTISAKITLYQPQIQLMVLIAGDITIQMSFYASIEQHSLERL